MITRRKLRYFVEFLLLRSACAVFGALPLDRASALGGRVARILGPRLRITERARDNLARALPQLSRHEREEVVADMWEHLGRIVAEYPHIGEIDVYGDDRVEVWGAEFIDQIRDDGIGCIAFSAHIGNWELLSMTATQRGLPFVDVYRPANNPWVDKLIQRLRRKSGARYVPRGGRGVRDIVAALKRGEHIGMLVDQKFNQGIAVPFFGRDAMTAPAIADLARRFQVPLMPIRAERLDGARFRITASRPFTIPPSNDPKADNLAVLTGINATIEDWVRATPAQWLWLHRRWPSDDQEPDQSTDIGPAASAGSRRV